MSKTSRALSAALLAVLALGAGTALSAEATYKAKLDGASMIPEPIKTPASGELLLTVSADGKSVRYVLTVKDITNPAAGDLHLGPPGANGPLVVKLFPTGSSAAKKGPFSGVLAQGSFDAADLTGPMKGAKFDELLDQIREGNAYCNVHTNDGSDPPNSGPGDYRVGEIRGQITP
jgi:hypothetical protein